MEVDSILTTPIWSEMVKKEPKPVDGLCESKNILQWAGEKLRSGKDSSGFVQTSLKK